MRSRTDLGGPKESEEHPEQGEGKREAESGAQERHDERTSRRALALIRSYYPGKQVQETCANVLASTVLLIMFPCPPFSIYSVVSKSRPPLTES